MALDFNIKPGGAMIQADGSVRNWTSSNRIAARHTVKTKLEIEALLSGSVAELITALPFLREIGDFADLLQDYEVVVSVSQKAAEPETGASQITLSSREELEELEEEEEEG